MAFDCANCGKPIEEPRKRGAVQAQCPACSATVPIPQWARNTGIGSLENGVIVFGAIYCAVVIIAAIFIALDRQLLRCIAVLLGGLATGLALITLSAILSAVRDIAAHTAPRNE